nr:MAG TPA: hypothetical protein [Caudoviricetes sp.]
MKIKNSKRASALFFIKKACFNKVEKKLKQAFK